MNSNEWHQFKPFISLVFVISTLLSVVFVKMEERRLAYVVLKLTKEHKRTIEIEKQKEIALAKVTRPQLVENMAMQKLTLKRVVASQIIHLTPTETIAKVTR